MSGYKGAVRDSSKRQPDEGPARHVEAVHRG
jgi:hypothetical protein